LTKESQADALAAEAQRVRRMLEAEGRSDKVVRLFDYLLAHSRDARAPKEIEIAFEVFGRDSRFDPSQDATVRVSVYRLRNRLDEIYLGSTGPRLQIPKADYRIVLVDASVVDDTAEALSPEDPGGAASSTPSPDGPKRRTMRLGLAALLGTVILWGGYFAARHWEQVDAGPGASQFWKGAGRCSTPLLVFGDSYLYYRADPADHSGRLIMRPEIRSATELGAWLAAKPAEANRIRDLDAYYMSTSAAEGLWPLLGIVNARRPGSGAAPPTIPGSKLTPSALNGSDIVYLGRLDQLGALHDLVFHASRFTFDPVSDTLQDRGAGRQFIARIADLAADENRNTGERPAYEYDYGYLARLTGAGRCQIWVIAGLQDSALPQMARLVADRRQLDELVGRTGDAPSFEALYEIRKLGELKYTTRLVLSRALETDR
jgi:hypothetical protein